jgi:hypothetical protein
MEYKSEEFKSKVVSALIGFRDNPEDEIFRKVLVNLVKSDDPTCKSIVSVFRENDLKNGLHTMESVDEYIQIQSRKDKLRKYTQPRSF